MNIIIEGVDGSYKSTVAQKLHNRLGYPIVKGSSFEFAKGSSEDLFNFKKSILTKDDQIIDRSLFSNLVYATIYPEYTRLNGIQQKKLEAVIRENSVVVYLTASPDTIISRLEQRGDEYVSTDKVASIITEYSRVMSQAVEDDVKIYTFDTGVLSSDSVVEQIVELLPLQDKSIITCRVCNRTEKVEHSKLSGTHCFHCYLDVMEEFFKENDEILNTRTRSYNENGKPRYY